MKEVEQIFRVPFRCSLKVTLLLILALGTSKAGSETIRVSPSGDNTTGESWGTAFNLVGEALANSASGDHIWVASGTYNESIALKEGVSLFGGFEGKSDDEDVEGREWMKYETIIDATGLQTVVVEAASFTVLDGFSVVGGDNREFQARGGGINLLNVEQMEIKNCLIMRNKAIPNAPYQFGGAGGGISVVNSNLRIANCKILHNIAAGGGGIGIYTSVVTIENSLIDKNTFGGGIFFRGHILYLQHCTFGQGNEDQINPISADLNAIFCEDRVIINNSIVRHVDLNVCSDQTSRLISNSNILGFPGNGNIDADPQWVDPENGDYRLKISSPCIDSGTITDATMDLDGNPRPIDVFGIGTNGPGAYDMGAFEFQLSPADLTRNGTVDGEDLIEFQNHWMQEGE